MVLLTEPDGTQNVHIAPEAFAVASVEFADEIQFWQDSLGSLSGQLESVCVMYQPFLIIKSKLDLQLSGAKVLMINNLPPFDAVNANAAIAGGYQALATRQNGYVVPFSFIIQGLIGNGGFSRVTR